MKVINHKRTIMFFSALFILAFHLWVFIDRKNTTEMFLIRTAYMGVDMFFFLSAYSMSLRPITKYKDYYVSRFTGVYLKFVIFAAVAAVVVENKLIQHAKAFVQGAINYENFFKVIFGEQLIKKGGGSFLWFLPAIMIFYLVLPLIRMIKIKPVYGCSIALIVWFTVGMILGDNKDYSQIFVFWNRIPALVLGYLTGSYGKYFAKYLNITKKGDKKDYRGLFIRVAAGLVLTLAGWQLLYKFGFTEMLKEPFPDMYYIVAIPAMLGLMLLLDLIPEIPPIKWIGSATLEMYAIQMIFGFYWANKFYMKYKNPWKANLATFALVIVVSVACQLLYAMAQKGIRMIIKKASEKKKR